MTIFICYRRQDSDAITGRIRDRLVSRYGKCTVFMDIDGIPIGTDCHRHVQHELRKARLVLAVIGPQWLASGLDSGRRIDEEVDPVRIELETALRARIPIIPLLVGAAVVPTRRDLPPSLKALADINAARVDAGRDFEVHIERLIHSIDALLAERANASHRPEQGLEFRYDDQLTRRAANRLGLVPFAAVGGLVPFVIKLHNEIEHSAFVLQPKYVLSGVLFCAIAAVSGSVFPYREATPWKALLGGLGFSLALGIAAAVARAAPHGVWLGDNSTDHYSWLTLLSLF